MATKVVLDNLEELPEEQRKNYKLNEEDNKYYLDVDPLLNAYNTTKEAKKSLQSKVDQLSAELGKVDVNKYQELLELEKEIQERKAKEAEEKAKAEGDMAALERQWQERFAQSKQEYESKLNEQMEQNNKIKKLQVESKRDADLRKAMQDAEVLHPHFLEHPIKERIKVEMSEDGLYNYKIVNNDGSEMFVFDGDKRVPATMTDLLSEFKKESRWQAAFAPTKMAGIDVSGGNTPSNAPTKGTITRSEFMKTTGEKWMELRDAITSGKMELVED